MCRFSHVHTSDSINTYRTDCPWVWPRPAWCHPPALPWDATENAKWSRSATFMIVLLRFGSHAPCCCLEMSEGMREMICRAVLFLVPGTTGTVKTAPCAVWSSCNILYVVYKQIPDTQLKEAFTRFHFMPTDPFTCYTLGHGVWMLLLWFTAHKSAQVLSARTVWTRCIISHILVNTRSLA